MQSEHIRNGDRRPPGSHSLERILDLPFCVGIQRRSGLVQKQNARVLQDGSGNGDLFVTSVDGGHAKQTLWTLGLPAGVHRPTTSGRALQPWSHTDLGSP